MNFDPETDLEIERLIAARPETVWRCWTDPALFAQWFAPRPVEVRDVLYEFRPGGRAELTMVLPDGTVMPLRGCVVEVDPARRLVTTDALMGGFRPAEAPFMTAIYTFTEAEGGTRLHAHVLHATAAGRLQHEEMGFHDGWGTTFEQLSDLAAAQEEDRT